MARAGLVHHDRTRLKRELEAAQDEWKHLLRHVHVLDKVQLKSVKKSVVVLF